MSDLERSREQRSYDPELAKFNARMSLFLRGEIEPLGDLLMQARGDDDPDGGEFARLIPPDLPPHLSHIALQPPEQEPLVKLLAA